MPASKTLSVVIPSYKRLDRLPGVVSEYVRQGADEVVVVLDGRHDGWQDALAEITALPPVTVVELLENRGLALVRVAGLGHATMDVLLMADDDVMPQPGLVDAHRAFHESTENSALLGYMPVALPERRGPDQSATFLYAHDYENQVAEWQKGVSSRVLLESFWGGNASLPRELYQRAEDFKPSVRLNYNEDLDLGLRLRELGAGAAFEIKAKGLHLHNRNLVQFIKECLVRGEAVADFEERWDDVPEQVSQQIQIPDAHGGLTSRLLHRVAARDTPGLLEAVLRMVYRVSGFLRVWRVQDAVSRFLRRALPIRGYRLARERNASSTTRKGH